MLLVDKRYYECLAHQHSFTVFCTSDYAQGSLYLQL
jgi:hypothetical protein